MNLEALFDECLVLEQILDNEGWWSSERLSIFSSKFVNASTQIAREGGGFKLRQRAEHVFKEEKRVLEFKSVCDVSVARLKM